VAYTKLPEPQPGGVCQERIYGPTVDARLLAVDAKTGQPCADFGVNGQVDLKKGMGEIIPGYYYVSSMPQVVRGKVVMGGWVSDGQMTGEPSGVIRAFDATTGAFAWAFDMGKPDFHGEPAAGEHYTRSTPNSWGPISADDQLGMVYIPTGNATPDYYAGHRTELDNKFSGSVLGINADNGKLVWNFQTTHYDVWDYDVASQPSLLDLKIRARPCPCWCSPPNAARTLCWTAVPASPCSTCRSCRRRRAVWKTRPACPRQPHSTGMPTFAGLDAEETYGVGEKDMWGMTMLDQLWCRIQFKKARWEGPMTPAGTDTVFFFPGSLGGSNWGSVSFDPERQIMVGNWNRVPMLLKLIDREEPTGAA
jgi:glucose dehydrogenase